MAQRRDRSRTGEPGLHTPPYAAVGAYPPAAVATAWYNARRSMLVPFDTPIPGIGHDEPLITAEAGVASWPDVRMPLGPALGALSSTSGWATAALPVPGDVQGIQSTRALAAGQALVIAADYDVLIVVPEFLPGGDRLWHASRVPTQRLPPADLGAAKRQLMTALESAVVNAEQAALPIQRTSGSVTRVVQQLPVPLPPGTSAEMIALAAKAAVSVTLAGELLSSDDELPDEVRTAIDDLGRAGRHALAVTFSLAGRR